MTADLALRHLTIAKSVFDKLVPPGGWRGFREPEQSGHWSVSTGSAENCVLRLAGRVSQTDSK